MENVYDTKTILVANQKGGVGKTFIADELCFCCEKAEVPYSLRDYDGQGGLIHTPSEHANPALIIIDTPGALQPQMNEWIKESDLIIVPTLMSRPCMEPLERMMSILKPWKAMGKKVMVVLNQWDRFTTCDDFAEWFDLTFPHEYNIEIASSEVIKQAQANGKSVIDYKPHSRSAMEVRCMFEHVQNILYNGGRR